MAGELELDDLGGPFHSKPFPDSLQTRFPTQTVWKQNTLPIHVGSSWPLPGLNFLCPPILPFPFLSCKLYVHCCQSGAAVDSQLRNREPVSPERRWSKAQTWWGVILEHQLSLHTALIMIRKGSQYEQCQSATLWISSVPLLWPSPKSWTCTEDTTYLLLQWLVFPVGTAVQAF